MTQLEQDFKRMYPMAPRTYEIWRKIREVEAQNPDKDRGKQEALTAFMAHFGKGPATYARWVKKDRVEVGK